MTLKFLQTGEISPNLFTLKVCLRNNDFELKGLIIVIFEFVILLPELLTDSSCGSFEIGRQMVKVFYRIDLLLFSKNLSPGN